MSLFVSFITGAVVGSVVTWSVDKVKPKLPELKRPQWPKQGWFSRSTGASIVAETTGDGAEPDTAVAEAPSAAATPVADTSSSIPDSAQPSSAKRLEDIKGIGPVYATRLREAGVATFANLAALTPQRVLEILSPDGSEGQLIHADDWIAQARELSGKTDS